MKFIESEDGNIEDRTDSLSYGEVNDSSAEALLVNKVVVIKKKASDLALDGIETAYRHSRRIALPRRIAGRVLSEAGFSDTDLYKRLRQSEVAADPAQLPWYMHPAQDAITTIAEINASFFEDQDIRVLYGERSINWVTLFTSHPDNVAFYEHQDSQGATGIAYAPQPQPTAWRIHHFDPENPVSPAPIDYGFTTERGDIVALMERTGSAPRIVPFRQGTQAYMSDGSLIHSGINLSDGVRFGMGAFHMQIQETIV